MSVNSLTTPQPGAGSRNSCTNASKAERIESVTSRAEDGLQISLDGSLNASVTYSFSSDGIRQLAEDLTSAAVSVAEGAGEVIGAAADGIERGFEAVKSIADDLSEGVEDIAESLANAAEHASDALEAVGEAAQSAAVHAGGALTQGGRAALEAVGTAGGYAAVGALLLTGVLSETV